MSDPDRPPGPGLERFNEIYEGEFEYVCRTLGRFGVPKADIPDAVHEVFLVLYQRWTELDHDRSLRPWLFGVARRIASDARAKQRATPEPEVASESSVDPSLAQRDLLWKAMECLDDDRRTVVILHDLEGHTGAQIAAMLDIPVNTVHSRLRLARVDLLAAVKKLGKP